MFLAVFQISPEISFLSGKKIPTWGSTRGSVCRPLFSNHTASSSKEHKPTLPSKSTFWRISHELSIVLLGKCNNIHLGIDERKRLPPSFFKYYGWFFQRKKTNPKHFFVTSTFERKNIEKQKPWRAAPGDSTFAGVFRFWRNHPYLEKSVPGCSRQIGQNVLHGPYPRPERSDFFLCDFSLCSPSAPFP